MYILDIEFMNLIIMEQNRNRIGAEWVEFWSSGAELNRETLEQNSDRPTHLIPIIVVCMCTRPVPTVITTDPSHTYPRGVHVYIPKA